MPIFTEPKRYVVSQEVRKQIREAIISGRLTPGTRLNETSIAANMGLSRAPVREALKQLEEEGLVECIPYKGSFVKILSEDELSEIMSLRSNLEVFTVKLALEKRKAKDIDDLQALVNEMREAAVRGDVSALSDLDLEFHKRIWQMSGHRRLEDILTGLCSEIRLVIEMSSALYEDFGNLVVEHQDIVDFFRRGELEHLIKYMENHVEEATRQYVDRMRSESGRSTPRDVG